MVVTKNVIQHRAHGEGLCAHAALRRESFYRPDDKSEDNSRSA